MDGIERVNFDSLPNGGDNGTAALVKLDHDVGVLADAADNSATAASALTNRVSTLETTATNLDTRVTAAKNSADNAGTAANNAQTTANTANSTANTATNTANAAMPKYGGSFSGPISVPTHVTAGTGLHVANGPATTNQGMHLSWNTLSSATADFVCNQGLGTGGFTFQTINSNNTAIIGTFRFTPTGRWAALQPMACENDNAANLGLPTNRWATVYAASGTIQTSDERTKTDVSDTRLGLDFIMSLRPVEYRMVVGLNKVEEIVTGTRSETVTVSGEVGADGSPGDPVEETVTYDMIEQKITPIAGVRYHEGLLAQEVAAALSAAGLDPTTRAVWTRDDPSDPESRQGLRYENFIGPLIRAVQELSQANAALAARVAALEARA